MYDIGDLHCVIGGLHIVSSLSSSSLPWSASRPNDSSTLLLKRYLLPSRRHHRHGHRYTTKNDMLDEPLVRLNEHNKQDRDHKTMVGTMRTTIISSHPTNILAMVVINSNDE
jgi:hypothetical protein